MFLRKCWLCLAGSELCSGDSRPQVLTWPKGYRRALSSHWTYPGRWLSALVGSSMLLLKACLIYLSQATKQQKAMPEERLKRKLLWRAPRRAWGLVGECGWCDDLCTTWRERWGRIPGALTLWCYLSSTPLKPSARAARWQRRDRDRDVGQLDEESFPQSPAVPGWAASSSTLGGKHRPHACPPSSTVLRKAADASTILISSNPSQLPAITFLM